MHSFRRYVEEFDEELPLETAAPEFAHPDVVAAQEEEREENRKRRIQDVKAALSWTRNRSKSLAQTIKVSKREREIADQHMKYNASKRDTNRLALALVQTPAEISAAHRFGLLAYLRKEVSVTRVGAIYGVKIDNEHAEAQNEKLIYDAALKLVPPEELDALRQPGL